MNVPHRSLLVATALLFALPVSSCGGRDSVLLEVGGAGGTDGAVAGAKNAGGGPCTAEAGGCNAATPITVVSISPQDTATDVRRDSVIVATFSDPISPGSVTPATFTVSANTGAIEGSFGGTGKTVTFAPTWSLPASTTFTVRIGTGVKGASGGALSVPFNSSFTTQDGSWGKPTLVEGSGGVAKIKACPLPYGAALAVWAKTSSVATITGIWSSTYAPTTGWGTPIEIDAMDGTIANYNADAFAVDTGGNGVVGWSQNKTIRAAHYLRGQGWQKPLSLGVDSSGDARFGGVAFDASGNAFGVWTQTRAAVVHVWGARYDRSSGWAQQAIDQPNQNAADSALAVSSTGKSLAVWQQGGKVWGSYYDGGWKSAAEVPTAAVAGTALSRPRAAFLSSTDAIIVWRYFLGSGTPQIWATRYLGASGWQQGSELPLPVPNSFDQDYPVVAAHEGGTAISAWSDTAETQIWGNSYDVASGWKTAAQLASGPGSVFVSLEMDASGNGLGAWTENAAHLAARRYQAGIGWLAATTFAPSSDDANVRPELGASSSGAAWLAWNYQGQGWAALFE